MPLKHLQMGVYKHLIFNSVGVIYHDDARTCRTSPGIQSTAVMASQTLNPVRENQQPWRRISSYNSVGASIRQSTYFN